MPRFKVSNAGLRDQAIRVKGGYQTVKSGGSAIVEPFPDLDEKTIEHFKARGVTFDNAKNAKSEKASAEKAAAEKAAAEKAAQEQTAQEQAGKLAAAEKAVTDAKALVDASINDLAAKAEAEKMLIAAEKALADLKA